MVDDLDIYRSAQVLVKRYGQDAEFRAAERCDAMIAAGDPEGLAVWKRILVAVDELLAQEPPKPLALKPLQRPCIQRQGPCVR